MSKIIDFIQGHTIKDIYYAKTGTKNYLIIEFKSVQEENPCIKIPVLADADGKLATPFLESFPISIDLIGAE